MKLIQQLKVMLAESKTVDNATVTSTAVDLAGYNRAAVLVSQTASDITLTAMKLQHSDDNSTWSDVTGGEWTTMPTGAAGDDGDTWGAELSLQKRYLRWSGTGPDGTTGAVFNIIVLGRPQEGPTTDAGRGGGEFLWLS